MCVVCGPSSLSEPGDSQKDRSQNETFGSGCENMNEYAKFIFMGG